MATLTDFRGRFPEFQGEEDARVQMFLDDAELIMAQPNKWLDFYDVAHLYLGAHYLVLGMAMESGDASPLSPISKQQVDDVLIENAIDNVSVMEDDLYSTTYGKQYVRYRRLCLTGMVGI